jgi:hypothetical protein
MLKHSIAAAICAIRHPIHVYFMHHAHLSSNMRLTWSNCDSLQKASSLLRGSRHATDSYIQKLS